MSWRGMPEVAQVALRGRHWLRAVVWVSEWTTALFSLGSNCPRQFYGCAAQSGMVTVRCRGGLSPAACRGLKRMHLVDSWLCNGVPCRPTTPAAWSSVVSVRRLAQLHDCSVGASPLGADFSFPSQLCPCQRLPIFYRSCSQTKVWRCFVGSRDAPPRPLPVHPIVTQHRYSIRCV